MRSLPRSTRTDTLCPSTTLFRSSIRPQKCVILEANTFSCAFADFDASSGRVISSFDSSSSCAGSASAETFKYVRSASLHSRLSSRRSEEHTSELQSLMRISYSGLRLNKKIKYQLSSHHKQ